MNNTTLKALSVILVSLGLALVFNLLFFSKPIGISVLVFVAIFLAVIYWYTSHQKISLKKTWWLTSLIIFFAVMPSIYENEFLTFLNVCATLGLLMLLAKQLIGMPPFLMKLLDYILLVLMPFRMLRRALSTVSLTGQIQSTEKNGHLGLRILKGVVMAIPILVIFVLLFSQADLAFSKFINSFVNITLSERTIQYIVLLCVAFIAALSFLSYIIFPKPEQSGLFKEKSEPKTQTIRPVEVMVFLGLIAGLFLVFIGFQVKYLFGGDANIINAGFTYAEYARHGFFELLVVAVLSLLVLVGSEKYAGVETKKDKQFMIPALILIAEIGVVIISAFKRLSLYIDAYGMTILRFYVTGFIILLSVLFIFLAVKFIKSKTEQFLAFGTLLSIAAFLIAVNLTNPDAFIIKTNIQQYNDTGKFDASYLRELSVDAEPWKIEMYNKLEGADKQTILDLLLKDKEKLQKVSDDWQGLNLSRSKALDLLQEIK